MNKKMLFPCLVFISFCLLAFINISAQTDWFFVALTADGNTIYIDKNFTRPRGGITQVWQKSAGSDDSYTISLTEWNCRRKSFRFIQSVVYENQRIVAQSDKKTDWRYFVPDSTGMLLYSNICPQQQTEKDYVKSEREQGTSAAQIIVKKAVFLSGADAGSRIIRRITLGERFVLTSEQPIGVWYRAFDRKTNKLGWLNGNDFKIIEGKKQMNKKAGVNNKRRSRN